MNQQYLIITGFTDEQKNKMFNTNFKKYLEYDETNKTIIRSRDSVALCKKKLFTLYKCILCWIDYKNFLNMNVSTFFNEQEEGNCTKKRKLLKCQHSVDPQLISKFIVDTDILYSESTKQYYVSFKRNGYYQKFDKINDIILLGWDDKQEFRPNEKDINRYCKENINTINALLPTRESYEDNCMVFCDGYEYFETVNLNDKGKRSPPFTTNEKYLDYHLNIIKDIFLSDDVDTTPSWVKDNMHDIFPLKSHWYTQSVDNVKKVESYKNDIKIIRHFLHDQFHYSHGNVIGIWCYGPSGVGKSHTLYDLPQQISPDKYLKIKNVDSTWKEFPNELHFCDDMPMKDRVDYLHNGSVGEQCPQRFKKPEKLKKTALYPVHLSNSLPRFNLNHEAEYQLIRRYIIFFKGKKTINIKLKKNGYECFVIKKIVFFLCAKYQSILKNNDEIALGDPTTYTKSPLLKQRYEAMYQIINMKHNLNPLNSLHYFYAWIIINTKKAKNNVGIDFETLYNFYAKRYLSGKRKFTLMLAIEEISKLGLSICECLCDKMGKTITHQINPFSKNKIWLILGYTTILY